MQDKLDCSCGKFMYGYETEIGDVFVCYSCGKYKGKNIHPILLEIATEDPNFILYILQGKNLHNDE